MLKIIHNPSYIFEDYKVWPMHYCKNNIVYDLFTDANITSINSIINNNNKLINNRQLENLFGSIICDDKIKQQFKRELCKENSRKIKSHILKAIDKNINFIIYENNDQKDDRFLYDNNFQAYEVHIDETFANGKAGYGIFYKRNNLFNYYNRAYAEQTLQNATFQGIEHVLKTFPKDKPLCIYLDHESVLKVVRKLPINNIKIKQKYNHV